MRVFHNTFAADAILAGGFRDGEGTYGIGEVCRGVWVSDIPLDLNEGAAGDTYIVIEIPDEVFVEYEWVEEGRPRYREALVPASILNAYPKRRWTEAEENAYEYPEYSDDDFA